MSNEEPLYTKFEIELGSNDGHVETETVVRITFQEAVQCAYLLAAKSGFSKKILCVRALS